MRGDRRESPDRQVGELLAAAKREGLSFEEAWPRATGGEVCDSYTSRRGARSEPEPIEGGPPNLRPAPGQKRCAGCRFAVEPGHGLVRCGLYARDVYPGVLWPHRTEERRDWQDAIVASVPEWRAAFEGAETAYSRLHGMLAGLGGADDSADVEHALSGTLAA